MTRDQRNAFAKVVKNLSDRFEKRVKEWNWHFPGREKRDTELEKELNIAPLRAAEEKAEKLSEAASEKVRAVRNRIGQILAKEEAEYLAEMRLGYARALVRLAATDDPAQAEKIVRELL